MRVCEIAFLVWLVVGASAPLCRADESESASLTVSKVAVGADHAAFDFTSPQLGAFTLGHGASEIFDGITSGGYEIQELVTPGWELYKIRVDSSTSAATDTFDWLTQTFACHLDAGEALEVTFYSKSSTPQEQPAPPSAPTPSALLLVGLGAAVSAALRRHRVI